LQEGGGAGRAHGSFFRTTVIQSSAMIAPNQLFLAANANGSGTARAALIFPPEKALRTFLMSGTALVLGRGQWLV